MNRTVFRTLSLGALLLLGPLVCGTRVVAAEYQYDVVVYGGTSGGLAAAVQVVRMGKTVAIVEPGKHLGGLTAGGLGATDIGNKEAIGGISREFYQAIGDHYAKDESWKHQTRDEYKSRRQQGTDREMWTFEPHVAENVYKEWVKANLIPVYFEERLDLKDGVRMEGQRLAAIKTEKGTLFTGKQFIDATYEGDLLAIAGVSYAVGREANAEYNETLNGVQTKNARSHQFIHNVDPYIVPGDPSSGLLPGVHGGSPGEEGAADKGVQAYCYRMCTTDVPANRRAWPKPEGYDPLRYELLLRNFEAGDHRSPWNPVWMPNRKTDTNNNFAISTDNIGMNYDYPEADYATRDKIIAEHITYQKGLMWTLANDERVPEKIREEFTRIGLAADEFLDNDNWPHQLYVREARRMKSDYVMTQHNCQGRVLAEDSVGLAAYGMDSHNIQRYVKDGYAINEGDVQVHGFAPYPISYRSIVPKVGQCVNLLVPVCMSATHISYGSIRMEPVFMVLGQSAATAAIQAIEAGCDVQKVDYAKLKEKLLADKQRLEWTGPRPVPPIEVSSLEGLVLDDKEAELVGDWGSSRSIGGFVGNSYLHDGDTGKGEKSATFKFTIPKAGKYEVRFAYTASSNRAAKVPVTIQTANGDKIVTVDQKVAPKLDKVFVSLGAFEFASGPANVVVSNKLTKGHVVIDAVQLLPSK